VTAVTEVLSAIDKGPKGPQIAAFFDLDGTLVQGYTAGTFYADRIRRREISAVELGKTLIAALDGTLFGGDPTRIADVGLAAFAGQTEDELAELGERLFVQKIAGTIRAEARELVQAHRRAGHTVVVASSATRAQVQPVARDLGIEHVLCTELVAENGVLTGASPGMLWGEAKARRVRAFARRTGVDLGASHAYANGQEDIPFLSSVGKPHALNPHPILEAAALEYGWPVLTLREPRNAGPGGYVRSAALLGGMNLGMGVGAAIGVLKRDRRIATNLGMTFGSDLGLALAGVRLNIVGEENLWRARPCVFVVNHQSGLDAPIIGSLLRRNYTGVAKKEAKWDPRMILLGAVFDPAFVDRRDRAQAVAQLDKVVERVLAGTSVVVFPEGTRSPTATLGHFKKGAFHVAMQARVPVVPIVIRNAGEFMPGKSMLVNPGTVDICVLDPIPTAGWSIASLDQHVAAVHQQFVDALENWPSGGGTP